MDAKKILIVCLGIIFINYIAFADPQVTQTRKGKKTTVYIEYKSKVELYGELDRKKDVQMWTEHKLEEEKNKVPDGGYLVIYINASTLGTADPSNFIYFGVKNSDTLFYQQGRKDIPDYSVYNIGSSVVSKWHSIDIVPIEKPIYEGDKFNVFVIDQVLNERNDYTVNVNTQNKINKIGYADERLEKANQNMMIFLVVIGVACLIGLLILGPSEE